jgi:uncharacterized membrane protein YfhO
MNINGNGMTTKSNSQLRVKILLPESYTKTLIVNSNDGTVDISLSDSSVYELELQSINGKVENTFKPKPTSTVLPKNVGQIKIRTNYGAISVRNLN